MSAELSGDGGGDEGVGAGDEDTHQHQERPVPGQAGVVKEVSGDGIRGQEAPGVRDDDVPSVIMLPVAGQLLVAQHEGDGQGQAHATH